jgi:hypothetical protein
LGAVRPMPVMTIRWFSGRALAEPAIIALFL